MAVSWSWAFGQETAIELELEMEWQIGNTAASFNQPSNLKTYTYPGSPARLSWAIDDASFNGVLELPTKVSVTAGWITVAYYVDGAYTQSRWLLKVTSNTNRHIGIWMDNAGAESFELFVDNVFKEAFVMAANNWQYVALKYDMSGTTWSGRVYVNGAAATAAHTDAGVAATSSVYRTEGIGNGTRVTYIAQYIVYNDIADAGEVPLYVTRVAPSMDRSDTGTWAPVSGGVAQVALTAGNPFDNGTHVDNVATASGDQVTTRNPNISVPLGISATSVLSATNHTYSTGTSITATAYINTVAGSAVTPDTLDTTYAFATTSTGLTGTSLLDCKYEVS